MSKFALVIALLIGSLSLVQAQKMAFEKGDIEFSAGVGLLPTFAKDGGSTLIPPLSLRLGYRLSNHFSLSAYAAYSSTETAELTRPTGLVEQFKNDFLIVGLRPAVHITSVDNWDIYGGFLAGYTIPTVERTVISTPADPAPESDEFFTTEPSFARPAENEFLFSGFIGANYFIGSRTAVFAEVGYGISIINAGVTFKL